MDFLKKLFPNIEINGSGSMDVKSRSESVQVIFQQLGELPETEANHMAAFGYLLGRVAHADLDISQAELDKMTEILLERGGLSLEKSRLVADLIKNKNEVFGATDNYIVAREFYENSEYAQRLELMRCLFMISAADDSISGEEESELKKMASELRILDEDFLDIRSDFREYREVLKQNKS